jgi:hypothetical protein
MTLSARLGAAVACAALLAACGTGARSAEDKAANSASAGNPLLNSDARPQPITATGCLTASGDRFVVTALDETPAVPTTTTYQLSGGDSEQLRAQVNREVRVAGEADPPKVADVRDAPTPAVGTSGGDAGHAAAPGTEPRVKTQETMRFAVRNLKVLSVTPTGDPCPTAPATSSGR